MNSLKNYNNLKIEDLENVAKEVVKFFLECKEESFVVYLEGNMGAGKTTFAQKIGKELGIDEHMQSPTFTLMREYDLDFEKSNYKNKYKKLLHIDAYRFEDKKEGHVLRLDDNKKDSIVLIEWPKNMYAPNADMVIIIEKISEEERNVKVEIIKN